MILEERSQLRYFPVIRKITLGKWYKKLKFCYKQHNKKIQVYQKFDADILPLAFNFINNETSTVFSCEFLEIFQLATLSEIKTPAQMFSC